MCFYCCLKQQRFLGRLTKQQNDCYYHKALPVKRNENILTADSVDFIKMEQYPKEQSVFIVRLVGLVNRQDCRI